MVRRQSHTEGHKAREHQEFLCTNCGEPFDSPEELAPHLERHRPVGEALVVIGRDGKQRAMTAACRRGCGRHFRVYNRKGIPLACHEKREHELNCDGRSPLVETERKEA